MHNPVHCGTKRSYATDAELYWYATVELQPMVGLLVGQHAMRSEQTSPKLVTPPGVLLLHQRRRPAAARELCAAPQGTPKSLRVVSRLLPPPAPHVHRLCRAHGPLQHLPHWRLKHASDAVLPQRHLTCWPW